MENLQGKKNEKCFIILLLNDKLVPDLELYSEIFNKIELFDIFFHFAGKLRRVHISTQRWMSSPKRYFFIYIFFLKVFYNINKGHVLNLPIY